MAWVIRIAFGMVAFFGGLILTAIVVLGSVNLAVMVADFIG
jgi:hypothetical protein